MEKIIVGNVFITLIIMTFIGSPLNADSHFGSGSFPVGPSAIQPVSPGGRPEIPRLGEPRIDIPDLEQPRLVIPVDTLGRERPRRGFLPVRGPGNQPPWEIDSGEPVRPFFPPGNVDNGEDAYCGPNALCGETEPTAPIPDKVCHGCEGPAVPVGGTVSGTVSHSYPYVVALLRKKAVMCTGVLLDNKRILTAAHCLCGKLPDTLFIGSSIYDGESTDKGFKRRADLSGKTSFFETGFCSASDQIPNPNRDLAIIETNHSLDLDNTFFPPLIEQIPGTFQPNEAIIVGFGANNQSDSGGVKSYARVNPVLCGEENVALTACLPGKEAVVINERRQDIDTCKGDSGGPLLLAADDGTTRLLAITSRKIAQGKEAFCGSGGVYALINQADILQWLQPKATDE